MKAASFLPCAPNGFPADEIRRHKKRLTIATTTRWRRDEALYDRSTKAGRQAGMHAAPVLAGICGVTDRSILPWLVSMKLASTMYA